jgi:DNA-binding XRE family transcriptional regulator
MNIQVIEHNGQPEYAVIDFHEYEKMRDALEDAEDLAGALAFKARLASGEEETFPSDLVERILIDGVNPVAEYRKYRGLTQKELAEIIGVQQAAIAQFESGKRDPSVKQLKKIATALDVEMDDLFI